MAKTQTKAGGAAKALLATAVALLAATAADARSACEYVPIHRILASAGGVYNLADGRQLKARKVSVGGCSTMPALPTGLAYPDTNSNYTVMSHESDACITGTGRDGSTPTYAGFQAIVIESNGFKFSADLVLEDIDAQLVDDPTQGWRETMSSLAMADGAVVRPTMTTKPGSLVAVQPFRVPRASLQEVGFPSSDDLLISGAAYSSWTETKNCPFMNDPTGQCKAFVSYPDPVDRLLIIYAITQKSANDPNAAAFFSEVTLGCGCQCAEKPGASQMTVPVEGSAGTCKKVPSKSPAYNCDFMGKFWCETAETTRWEMTGSRSACASVPSTIQVPVSSYTPDSKFGKLPEP